MRALTALRPRLAMFLVLATLAAFPARPQTFEGTSQVVSVEVPVNVVTRDGQPVRGLTAEDFEVYDGGDRQKVTSFEVVDLKALHPEAGAAPAATAPAEVLRPAARRHFLLLFDLSFSTPSSILKARMAARDFVLNSLTPTDLAAVATYSLQTGPKLIVTFTPDRAQLARAVETLGYHQSFDARIPHESLGFLVEQPDTALLAETAIGRNESPVRQQIDQAIYEYLQSVALAAEKQERDFQMGRINSYTRALAQMAKTLSTVEGRKQVIFFSEGFDSRLLVGRDTTDKEAQQDSERVLIGQSYYVDNDQRFGNTSLQDSVRRMLEVFRRADCVIQAVDIGGLRAGADQQGRPSGEAALFYFANETGGQLFKDANNLREPLDKVLEQTSVTYLLSFERSDLKPDGAYHRLKVKAKLPAGARLTSREGYFAPRPFKDLDPLEKNLLASDEIASAAPKRELDLNVLAAPFRAAPGQAYLPVIIEAAGKSLLAGMTGKEKKLNVEIYAYVSDEKGRMLDYFNRRVALSLDAKARASIAEGGIKYYGHFDLEPGTFRVRVLVRNADSGKTGVETVTVTVPAYNDLQPVLLPPFFMEQRQKWLLVREQAADGSGQESVVYPFTVGGEPYVPAARPVLNGEKSARLCLVAYNLGKGELAVKGEVLTADGKASASGKLSAVERTVTGIKGFDKLTATFDPAGLSAGHYVLQVAVTDPATGRRQTNSLPFQVIR